MDSLRVPGRATPKAAEARADGRYLPFASTRNTGRTNTSIGRKFDFLSSKIQMLSLATQCRQYTTIRLPRSQGSLPVASLTTLTLWARTIHTLLTFSPQDNITSIAPLLRMRPMSTSGMVGRRRQYSTTTFKSTGLLNLNVRETEIAQLALSPSTIGSAVSLYREMIPLLPLNSLTPWMLLSRCYEMSESAPDELEWLTQSIGILHGHEEQSVHELLLLAYMNLGQDQQLRDAVAGLCIVPAPISSNTLVLVLAELQGSRTDRQLACQLWELLLDKPGFSPSRTCVHLAMKIAMHTRRVKLAVATYQAVLSRRWRGVQPGFWAEKTMVYGLAINGMADEAFEVTAATTDPKSISTSQVSAIQAMHKYEVLLNGLSKARCADEAVAVFEYVRNELGLCPSISMYNSLLGVVAAESGDWNVIEEYLQLMEDDGCIIPDTVWKRIMLGVARQGHVHLCDKVLDIMVSRGIPHTYVIVMAAIEAFAQQGNLEMVMRWYHVIYKALEAQAKLPASQQQAVSADSTASRSRTDSRVHGDIFGHTENQATLLSIQHPEDFVEYFVGRNELIWHRGILVSLIDIVGELGDAPLLMRLWEDIFGFEKQVRTLRISPYMYMSLARSLARHGLLNRYEIVLRSWIRDERNGFSYSQQQEALGYVHLCLSNYRPVLRQSKRMKAASLRNRAEFRPETDISDELHGSADYSSLDSSNSVADYDDLSSSVASSVQRTAESGMPLH